MDEEIAPGGAEQETGTTPVEIPPVEEEFEKLDEHLAILSGRQQRFVLEFLKDFNATRAAIRSGYKVSNARFVGYALLNREPVQRAIEIEKARAAEATRVEVYELIRELKLIAFSDIEDYTFGADGWSIHTPPGMEETTRAVATKSYKSVKRTKHGGEETEETTSSLKLWNKMEALKMLCEHVGLLDKPESDRSPGVVVIKGVDQELVLGIRKAQAQSQEQESIDERRLPGGENA